MVGSILETTQHQPVLVDWQMLSFLAEEKDGIPHEVGIKIH